jgi:D-alanyl-D-alanine carboxypeptidase/D-alanyl-D-alanine-endopeptidase (penicillin-binding protein 4)
MLRYSNNFTANQLFLTLGAHSSGYPATVEAARKVLQQQLTVLYGDGFGNEPQSLFMLEGSGLSREQRSSAAGMMRILEVFKPNAELLAETNGVLRKSGTLTGVYNFAGYISGPDGLYPFVILTNQAVNNRAEILRILQGIVN